MRCSLRRQHGWGNFVILSFTDFFLSFPAITLGGKAAFNSLPHFIYAVSARDLKLGLAGVTIVISEDMEYQGGPLPLVLGKIILRAPPHPHSAPWFSAPNFCYRLSIEIQGGQHFGTFVTRGLWAPLGRVQPYSGPSLQALLKGSLGPTPFYPTQGLCGGCHLYAREMW